MKQVRTINKQISLEERFQFDMNEEDCQYCVVENSKKAISHSDRFDSLPTELKNFENDLGLQLLYDSSNIFKVREQNRVINDKRYFQT